ncbi:putative Polyprotein [Cucumis melo var. makuwa]|uniref:Polyprotein n=1 Tax=Cucumis melo var. makuwa TaxID=1194695 RepID=A0A5A7ULE9_CUCMM|nr:putative Polyprotein [Cucumis melo var. makuwa]
MYNMEEDSKDLIEALSSIDANLWQEAINDEMDSLESNRTWHLVDLPISCKAIGCKWVLRKKLNPDGSVDKYTARLVAKGFRQRKNINFFDTFSAITRIISIRVMFAIATLNNLLVHQMDVKIIALLNGDLEEEIYIEQPKGFIIMVKNLRPACTPYNPSVKLFKSIGDSVNQSEYASIIVIVDHVWTDDNLADPLTKGLAREKVSEP